METREKEYTNVEIKNLVAKGVAERFLRHVGSAVIIGFLAAVVWGFSGLPAPDSAHRGDFAGAKIFEDCGLLIYSLNTLGAILLL
jgi:ABC-type Fe3+ transport system permease subunit